MRATGHMNVCFLTSPYEYMHDTSLPCPPQVAATHLPGDEADAIEESGEDVPNVVGRPAVTHVRHVARLEQP